MTSRLIPLALAALLALAQLSCAVGGGAPATGGAGRSGPTPSAGSAAAGPAPGAVAPPAPRPMPPARAGLRPEFRIFYDYLVDYGDWVLIEPYGWVFRPDVNFVAWRPYDYGFWVPTDLYGWVWVSSEPFGWVTYHYGNWLRDPYQGWVWIPGIDWGPAWVAWVQAGDYVGWGPLPPTGAPSPTVDPGFYSFAPVGALGSTELRTRIVPAEKVAPVLAEAKPAENVVKRGDVAIIRGPRIDLVERMSGHLLPRVAIVDPLAPAGATASETNEEAKPPTREEMIEAARRAAADAARQARALLEHGGPVPSRIPVVRPAPVQPSSEPATPERPRKGGARPQNEKPGGAAADSSR